ncbi:TRAP-type C4-dicarboxylate transport system, small permease component [Tranquillimonas rosea]|uniref:TRAP transporter small permease protein n=1 Tax=Tranquillimonas rosea TaxID=641238 RepID=A0A1H9WJ64_9RHOB|nr:TRAP-type C4-dicarboxylate transport system, small permease component [Tranquillimonas rosea]
MTSQSDESAQHGAESVSKSRALPEAGRLGRIVDKGGWLFAAGIVVAAIILLIEVFLRYVFNSPTSWAHETTTFLCGIAFLYGGLFCAARNTHVRVVLIYDALPARLRRIFDVVISAASAVAALFFAYAAWLMVQKAVYAPSGDIRLERSGSAWNPPYPAFTKIFLLAMLILLTAQFIVLTFNHFRRLRAKAG